MFHMADKTNTKKRYVDILDVEEKHIPARHAHTLKNGENFGGGGTNNTNYIIEKLRAPATSYTVVPDVIELPK